MPRTEAPATTAIPGAIPGTDSSLRPPPANPGAGVPMGARITPPSAFDARQIQGGALAGAMAPIVTSPGAPMSAPVSPTAPTTASGPDAAGADVAALRRERDDLKGERDDLKVRASGLEAERRAQEGELADLTGRAQRAEQRVVDLERRLHALEQRAKGPPQGPTNAGPQGPTHGATSQGAARPAVQGGAAPRPAAEPAGHAPTPIAVVGQREVAGIAPGETLEGVARRLGVTLPQLRGANPQIDERTPINAPLAGGSVWVPGSARR
jgi:hypothetical protein